MSVEPNSGVNAEIIDLRWNLIARGEENLDSDTAITLQRGRPMYLPLSVQDGRQLGMVIECLGMNGGGVFIGE